MALDRNKATREFYDADTGKRNGMNPFWGWSSLAYVMIFDLEDNYDPTNLAGPVRPLLRDVLGIRFNQSKAGNVIEGPYRAAPCCRPTL